MPTLPHVAHVRSCVRCGCTRVRSRFRCCRSVYTLPHVYLLCGWFTPVQSPFRCIVSRLPHVGFVRVSFARFTHRLHTHFVTWFTLVTLRTTVFCWLFTHRSRSRAFLYGSVRFTFAFGCRTLVAHHVLPCVRSHTFSFSVSRLRFVYTRSPHTVALPRLRLRLRFCTFTYARSTRLHVWLLVTHISVCVHTPGCGSGLFTHRFTWLHFLRCLTRLPRIWFTVTHHTFTFTVGWLHGHLVTFILRIWFTVPGFCVRFLVCGYVLVYYFRCIFLRLWFGYFFFLGYVWFTLVLPHVCYAGLRYTFTLRFGYVRLRTFCGCRLVLVTRLHYTRFHHLVAFSCGYAVHGCCLRFTRYVTRMVAFTHVFVCVCGSRLVVYAFIHTGLRYTRSGWLHTQHCGSLWFTSHLFGLVVHTTLLVTFASLRSRSVAVVWFTHTGSRLPRCILFGIIYR